MTGLPGSKKSYGYPNQMGRIILHVTQKLTTPAEYSQLMAEAGLAQYIDHPPAADLDHGFLFESVSALQLAAETIYGAEAGREFNRKVGRACLEGGLSEFNPLLGIADLPTRILPLGLKLHVGFDMFAMVFNRFSDQVVTLTENSKSYQWVIERCPVCWGRHTDAPCCNLAVGILEAGLRWASGGREFQVVEIQCVAMGAEQCVIDIPKRPLQG